MARLRDSCAGPSARARRRHSALVAARSPPARSARAASRPRCRSPRTTARRRSRRKPSRRKASRSVRRRREAGARMVEAVSVGRVERARRRRLAQQPDARRHRQEPRRRARAVAGADRQLAAADHRRGRPGDAQSRVSAIPEFGRRTRCSTTCSSASPGAIHVRPVRRGALGQRGARRASRTSGVSVRCRAPRAGRQHRDRRRSTRPRCVRRSIRPSGSWRSPTTRRATRSGATSSARVSHADALNAQQSAASLCGERCRACSAMADATRHALAVLLGRTPDAGARRPRPRELHVPQDSAGRGAVGTAARRGPTSRPPTPPSKPRRPSRRRDGAVVPEPVAVGVDGQRRLQLAGGALGRGRDLEHRRVAVAADVSWRRTARRNGARRMTPTTPPSRSTSRRCSPRSRTSRIRSRRWNTTRRRSTSANVAAARRKALSTKPRDAYRLGALPLASARASEQQYRNAQLNAIRYTSARLTDTAALFQAMGSPAGLTQQANAAASRHE